MMPGNSVQAWLGDAPFRGDRERADASRALTATSPAERLPPYADYQMAYHCAFRAELRQMLADVFRVGVSSALDVACGDGTYASWLGELFGRATLVVAVDTNLSWLQRSRRRRRETARVHEASADASRLPFEDHSFGAVWCAQSLCSLPDAAAALQEMHRVTAPGGTAAVLENDALHELMLPWPPELELAVREAELTAFRRRSSRKSKYYAARFLPQAFHAAGFRSCAREPMRSAAWDRSTRKRRSFLSATSRSSGFALSRICQAAFWRGSIVICRPPSRLVCSAGRGFH